MGTIVISAKTGTFKTIPPHGFNYFGVSCLSEITTMADFQAPVMIPPTYSNSIKPTPTIARLTKVQQFILGPQAWKILVWLIAVLIALPVLVVLGQIFFSSGETWQHLATTVLKDYILNSFWLMLGVSSGVTLIGVGTAWLVTMCQFWGSGAWSWLLLLPFAAPAYILAYTYTDFLSFEGPVQSGLRAWTGWEWGDYWFPEIRSLGGAILMLTLVLYPYVYLLARVAFLEQATCTLEASRSLGCGPWRSFWTVALPLARPGIAAGVALALMETLNDFGTVQYFGVDTFTTGIYRTWFGLGDRTGASQLASVLLLFIFGLVLAERWSRGQARFTKQNNSDKPRTYTLKTWRAILANLACFLPVALGFLIPALVLLRMAMQSEAGAWNEEFWVHAGHSLILSSLAAVLAVILAVFLAYGLRLFPAWSLRLGTQLAVMGYAIPGAVIAVGILVPLGWIDNQVDSFAMATFNISTGLVLSGTIVALLYAYLVRFLAVSFNSIEANLLKIRPSLDEAARSLGKTVVGTLISVHLPLLTTGLLTAAMMVFVDVMKELPATLVIRPFNFDTLAIQVYRLASDERLSEAAGGALAIVGVGLIPVLWLSWQIHRSGYSSSRHP